MVNKLTRRKAFPRRRERTRRRRRRNKKKRNEEKKKRNYGREGIRATAPIMRPIYLMHFHFAKLRPRTCPMHMHFFPLERWGDLNSTTERKRMSSGASWIEFAKSFSVTLRSAAFAINGDSCEWNTRHIEFHSARARRVRQLYRFSRVTVSETRELIANRCIVRALFSDENRFLGSGSETTGWIAKLTTARRTESQKVVNHKSRSRIDLQWHFIAERNKLAYSLKIHSNTFLGGILIYII